MARVPCTAMHEAQEARDHLELAVAAGAIAEAQVAEAHDLADEVAATRWKIVGQRRWTRARGGEPGRPAHPRRRRVGARGRVGNRCRVRVRIRTRTRVRAGVRARARVRPPRPHPPSPPYGRPREEGAHSAASIGRPPSRVAERHPAHANGTWLGRPLHQRTETPAALRPTARRPAKGAGGAGRGLARAGAWLRRRHDHVPWSVGRFAPSRSHPEPGRADDALTP